MSEREFQTIRFFMLIRAVVAAALLVGILATIAVLVYSLGTTSNAALNTILGALTTAEGGALLTVANSMSRDITEYLERTRTTPMADQGDGA